MVCSFILALGSFAWHVDPGEQGLTECLSMKLIAESDYSLGEMIAVTARFTNHCGHPVTLFTRLEISRGGVDITIKRKSCTWKPKAASFTYSEEDYQQFFVSLGPGRSYKRRVYLQGDKLHQAGILEPGSYHVSFKIDATRPNPEDLVKHPDLFQGLLNAQTTLEVKEPNLRKTRRYLKALKRWSQGKRTRRLEASEVVNYFAYVKHPEVAELIATGLPWSELSSIDAMVCQGAREELESWLALCKREYPEMTFMVEEALSRLDAPPCPPDIR